MARAAVVRAATREVVARAMVAAAAAEDREGTWVGAEMAVAKVVGRKGADKVGGVMKVDSEEEVRAVVTEKAEAARAEAGKGVAVMVQEVWG